VLPSDTIAVVIYSVLVTFLMPFQGVMPASPSLLLVALVRQLRRKRPKGGQRSLRDVSAEFAQRGISS